MTDMQGAAATISAERRFSLGQAKPLQVGKPQACAIAESDEATYRRFTESLEGVLAGKYASPPDLSQNPAYKNYAQVVVGNKVVATIDNNGGAMMSNALGAKLADDLPGSVNGKSGPVLAQARAETIARLLGGKVVGAPTALTQQAWEGIPTPVSVVDRTAMADDAMFASLQQLRQSRAAFLAQQLAQSAREDSAGS